MTANFQSSLPGARVQAAALRAAFPAYVVNVITGGGGKPRYEVVSRDGGSPYCLISTGAREIWHELSRAPAFL
jgi:acyl-CoA reductase-like NAD-dependent aldehyde dehydrogenase